MDNSGGKTGVKQKLKSVKAIYFAYKITLRPVRIIFNRIKFYRSVLKARNYLEKICKKYPDYCVVHSWCSGIGDDVLTMAYLKAFREKIGKKILLVSPENTKELIERYSGYDDVIFLEKNFCNGLNQAFQGIRIGRKWYENLRKENRLVCTCVWFLVNDEILRYLNGLYWLNVLRDVIYKIPEDSPVQFPAQKKTDVPLNQKRILVNPFSNSSRIPVESMTEIIDFFRAEGYAIFTNCVQADSFCFDGTERYCKSFMELYDEADSFEYIVSVRSGIVDLLASRNLRKIVLRSKSPLLKNIYSMKMWKCDALEMDFDAPDRMERIKKFVEEKS